MHERAVTNKPRIHHFVPRFWIENFRSADGRLWAYDWKDDAVRDRSPKVIMQVRDLYTIQPSGIDDTSLETIDNMKLDNDGAALFQRVLGGATRQSDKEELAAFLAVQALRDPAIIAAYNPKAQEFALFLLEIPQSADYQTFAAELARRYPSVAIRTDEYDYLKSLGPADAERAIDALVTALSAPNGLPELPFTDLIRSPDGRVIIRDRLLSFEWTLKQTLASYFVLGDRCIAYEKGNLTSLRVPLSKHAALYLKPTDAPASGIHVADANREEVEALNWESAAYARRWLVGELSAIEPLKHQIERNSFLL